MILGIASYTKKPGNDVIVELAVELLAQDRVNVEVRLRLPDFFDMAVQRLAVLDVIVDVKCAVAIMGFLSHLTGSWAMEV